MYDRTYAIKTMCTYILVVSCVKVRILVYMFLRALPKNSNDTSKYKEWGVGRRRAVRPPRCPFASDETGETGYTRRTNVASAEPTAAGRRRQTAVTGMAAQFAHHFGLSVRVCPAVATCRSQSDLRWVLLCT